MMLCAEANATTKPGTNTDTPALLHAGDDVIKDPSVIPSDFLITAEGFSIHCRAYDRSVTQSLKHPNSLARPITATD